MEDLVDAFAAPPPKPQDELSNQSPRSQDSRESCASQRATRQPGKKKTGTKVSPRAAGKKLTGKVSPRHTHVVCDGKVSPRAAGKKATGKISPRAVGKKFTNQ